MWTDTEYAGCKRIRKSTSGGTVMLGSHLIKSWTSTQSVVALSSGEAEYYGVVKGGSVLFGAISMAKAKRVQKTVYFDAEVWEALEKQMKVSHNPNVSAIVNNITKEEIKKHI